MTDVFRIPEFHFPENFFWGSSTAAFQIEGNNVHSDWWHKEQEWLKKNPNAEVSGAASNSYEMYREDIRLLKQLGHQAYRFGIEWSRVEPSEGTFNQEAADHYVRQLAELKEAGIKTFVTLIHITIPQWFEEKGSFYKPENWSCFEKYLNFILPQIAPYVDIWNVLNEFNIGTPLYYLPFKQNSVIFHARAYHLIKKYSSAPVSTAHALNQYVPMRQYDQFDQALAAYNDALNNEFFFHAIRTGEVVMPNLDTIYDKDVKDTCDFWSINMYTRTMINTRKAGIIGERYPFTKLRSIHKDFYLEEFFPETIFHCLTRLRDKPIIVSENGYSCEDDRLRIVFITEYLCALSEAIKAGADVRGYMYWSLLDNYEWGSFLPKFGLVDVDREHGFLRTPRPSAYFYKEIIENNGYSPKMLEKYLKEIPHAEELPIITY